jgi:hypothetical protein
VLTQCGVLSTGGTGAIDFGNAGNAGTVQLQLNGQVVAMASVGSASVMSPTFTFAAGDVLTVADAVYSAPADSTVDAVYTAPENWAAVTTADAAQLLAAQGANVVIPGPSVLNITASAFMGSALSSAVLPNSIIAIGAQAFQDCTLLSSVSLGSALLTIGEQAFMSSGLTSIAIPDSVTTIGAAAFRDCASLVSVSLGPALAASTIGVEAFMDSGLTSILIPDSITDISKHTPPRHKSRQLPHTLLSREPLAPRCAGVQELRVAEGCEPGFSASEHRERGVHGERAAADRNSG